MRLYADVSYDYFRTAGNLIFTAGACPLDESGEVVGPGDLETQALRAVDNLIAVLTTAGADLDTLLKTTIFVASSDQADLVRVWRAMAPHLGRAPSALLGVAVLGYPASLSRSRRSHGQKADGSLLADVRGVRVQGNRVLLRADTRPTRRVGTREFGLRRGGARPEERLGCRMGRRRPGRNLPGRLP